MALRSVLAIHTLGTEDRVMQEKTGSFGRTLGMCAIEGCLLNAQSSKQAATGYGEVK